MTKTSAILICPTIQLNSLPDAERDVLRRFWTQHVRGMDRQHDRRLRSLVRDLFNAEPGEGFQLYRAQERGGQFHKRHRAILTRLFESQDRYPTVDALHDVLKLRCWFVEWVDGKPRPRSTAFDACSEQEIREFHTAMVELLHDPRFNRRFWGHLTVAQRAEMVETLLRDPKEQEGSPA